MQFMMRSCIIIVLPTWVAANWFGIDPRAALPVISLMGLLAFVIVVRLPMRVSAESKTFFRGTPEQLFQIGTDVKLSLQVIGGRRTLVSQTGEPGQPGSSYVTEVPGLVVTTTVVSSDPPRKLMRTISARRYAFRLDDRSDVESTYRPVAGGTLVETRTRRRISLVSWLHQRRPAVKRAVEAEVERVNVRIRDYLASDAANEVSAGT
ncbi:MAG TPA: hypothetical protein VGV88_03840 [Candidatus Dormibacteraeota bacterium]|nr:hypothetical protein [Candidatus Dormibacteraeota bacterium]